MLNITHSLTQLLHLQVFWNTKYPVCPIKKLTVRVSFSMSINGQLELSISLYKMYSVRIGQLL